MQIRMPAQKRRQAERLVANVALKVEVKQERQTTNKTVKVTI